MAQSWWRRWLNRASETSRRERAGKSSSRRLTDHSRWKGIQLNLERLEDRLAPAVMTWTGGGPDGNWSTAANWGGTAPSPGDFLIFPSGVTNVSTNNDYTAGTAFGGVLVSGAGYTLAGDAVTLGGGGLSVSGGGTTTASLPITLGAAAGLVNSGSGELDVTGPIDQADYQLTLDGSGTVVVSGTVSGAGGLVKSGTGEAVLAVANAYTGGTQIEAGTLDVQDGGALGGGGGVTLSGGTLRLDGSFTVAGQALTFVANDGTLSAGGDDAWSAGVSLVSGSYNADYFQVDPGATLTLQSGLTGVDGTDTYVQGGGVLDLAGSSSVAGAIFDYYSTLRVDGSLGGPLINIFMFYGTLSGEGTVSTPVTLNYAGSAGALAATLNADGTGYGLAVSDPMDVSGAALNVSLGSGFIPAVGAVFTLVNRSGAAGPVAGTFTGLPEGGLLTVDGTTFQVSYQGGADGQDVTLTTVATDVWTGAGVDGNWSDAANWQGNVAPSPGDFLIFPSGVTNVATNNDYAAGTAFGGVLVSGAGYTLAGDAVTLGGGGLSVSGGGTTTASLPITLGAAAGLVNSGSGELDVTGPIDQADYQLTLDGSGTVVVSGTVSGAGGLVKSGTGEAVLAVANAYTGGTQIEAGTLDVQDGGALGGGGGVTLSGGTLRLDGSFTVAGQALTFVANDGTLSAGGDDAWSAGVSLVSGSYNADYFQVDPGATLTLQSGLTGVDGTDTYVQGGGVLDLAGSSSVAGAIFDYYSTLRVDGSLGGPLINIFMFYGTLSGEGTVSTPVTLNYAGSAGALAATLNADGTGYGLAVSDPMDVSGAALNVSLGSGFIPAVGAVFTLVNRSGAAGPVAGTFTGLPEGGLLTVDGTTFQVSYQGGADGQDVTLTTVATDVWTGAGVDGNWSDAANWQGNVAPSPGDFLIFPSGVTNVATNNDYAAGTAFGGVLVSGAGYTLAGDAVTLGGGGLSVSGGGTTTASLPITLGAAAGLVNSGSGELDVTGPIDQADYQLTLDGSGTVVVSGTVSGAGGLVKSGTGEAVLAVANAYTGGTQIEAGTLDVQDGGALGGGGGVTLSGGTLRLDGSFTVAGQALTFVANDGTLSAGGDDAWSAGVSLVSGSYNADYFQVDPGATLTLQSGLTGVDGTDTYVQGGGVLDLAGSSSVAGAIFDYYSTLRVDGSLGGPLINIFMFYGTLSGEGTVSTPVTLNYAGSAGALAATLNADGTGYGLAVSDPMDVSGAALNVSLGSGFIPAVGAVFTLVNRSGAAGPVAGTFTGLPEGGLLTVSDATFGDVTFQVSYQGGADGQDVTLTPIAIQANSSTEADKAIAAVNGLPAQSTPVTVQLNLAGGSYTDIASSPPAGVTLVISGNGGTTTIVGQSPALTVSGGNVIVTGMTLTTATNAPTILVTGGSLTLRNDTIQASTGFSDAAISITGGTVDLGTTSQPGGNVINVNGTGEWMLNASPNPVSATGDTFEVNGTVVSTPATVVDPTVSVTSNANPSDFNQSVKFTATVANASSAAAPTGSVEFFDGSIDLGAGSALHRTGSGYTSTISIKSLLAGVDTVIAVYTATGNFVVSSGMVTQTVNPATPTVSVKDAGGVYNGSAYPATATVAGVVARVDNSPAPTLEGVGLTLDYVQINADGSQTDLGSAAPVGAGSYTVTAAFAGSADYAAASKTVSFTIRQAAPKLTVVDASGVYNGLPYMATDTVAGVDNSPASSLEGVGLTLDYVQVNAGGANSDLGSSAPVGAGSYTVTVAFAGSADYAAASKTVAFTIRQAAPKLAVTDASGVYNGSAYAATATVAGVVVGVDNSPAPTLEGVGLTLDYVQVNSDGSKTDLGSTAPTGAGSYTVTASFAGSADYAAVSKTVAFTIRQAAPKLAVTDASGTYNGSAYAAMATVAGVVVGVDNSPAPTLEGVGLTLDYVRLNTDGSKTDLGSAAPTGAGSYTVTASFAGSADYAAASKTVAFTIRKAAPVFSDLSSPSSIVHGTASTTFTGELSVSGLFPTGTVTVTLTGPNGATASGSASLNANGSFSVTVTTGSLPAGSYKISYAYGGDANFASASDNTSKLKIT